MVLIYNKRLEVHYSVILERIPKCHMTPNETSTWQWWGGKLNFKRKKPGYGIISSQEIQNSGTTTNISFIKTT